MHAQVAIMHEYAIMHAQVAIMQCMKIYFLYRR